MNIASRQRLPRRCDQLGQIDAFSTDSQHVAVVSHPKHSAKSFGIKLELTINIEQLGVNSPLIQRKR